MKKSKYEIESGYMPDKRLQQISPIDGIIQNQGFQHLTEKILLNLPVKDLISLLSMNKTLKQILEDPMFWIKKWTLKGLSKKNKDDWMKAIQLTKTTKLAGIIILYIKKVLHRNRIVDMPCHIDEKTVEKFSNFTDENAFQNYFEEVFEQEFHQRLEGYNKKIDAGNIQICIAMVKNPNAAVKEEYAPIHIAIDDPNCNNIVLILAPFIGNANAKINGYYWSPIQYAIGYGCTETIKLLAPFCNDYNHDEGSLLHFAVQLLNVNSVKILASFKKTLINARDIFGRTPIELATRILGSNHEIVQILKTFQ